MYIIKCFYNNQTGHVGLVYMPCLYKATSWEIKRHYMIDLCKYKPSSSFPSLPLKKAFLDRFCRIEGSAEKGRRGKRLSLLISISAKIHLFIQCYNICKIGNKRRPIILALPGHPSNPPLTGSKNQNCT